MHVYSRKMGKQLDTGVTLSNENNTLLVHFGRMDDDIYVSRMQTNFF